MQSQEYITTIFSVPEGNTKTEQKLLIITQKGKIKTLDTAKLKKVSNSGKKIINLYQKVRVKCPRHQSQLEQHKTATCCDKSQGIQAYVHCSAFKNLQKQIKECSNCQELKTKKHTAIIPNALRQVCLFDKSASSEIYLLSQEAIC